MIVDTREGTVPLLVNVHDRREQADYVARILEDALGLGAVRTPA